jgi:Chagasin family peptidase inhibitor I42
MKLKFASLFLLLLALTSNATSMDYFEYDLDDPNSLCYQGPLKLKIGDEVRFVVDENPTTGYTWQLAPDDGYEVTLSEYRPYNTNTD